MKKGPLSKKEKTFIKNGHSHASVTELSSKMNRSENMINKYIATLASQASEEKAPAVEQESQVQDVGDLFARNEKYGATIMTETASVTSDENKKCKPKMPARTKNCIHRIKE